MAKTLVSSPTFGPQKFCREFYLCYMFDIVPSYHCMQFQGKLMNHTWENGKKTSFETDFGPFGPHLGPQILFMDFTSTTCYTSLEAIIVCNFKENKRPKLEKMEKKKTSFRTNFGPFVLNLGPKILFHRFYLQCMLDIVASYYKLEKMVKNLVSKPILAPLAQI